LSAVELRPRPHWGSLQRCPRPPSCSGLLLKGGEREEKGRRRKGRGEEGGEKRKGEERRGEGEGEEFILCIAVRKVASHTATGTHMPYGITQCYLPPDRGDIPALTPAEAGTR